MTHRRRYGRKREAQLPQAALESLVCLGGPWHRQRKLLAVTEPSLRVPTEARFRYVRARSSGGDPYLAWSNDETRW